MPKFGIILDDSSYIKKLTGHFNKEGDSNVEEII